MAQTRPTHRNPWAWVSTLYLAEGLPYVVVMTVAVIMYKGLGISNTDIALYTSWLYLPWVIKPLWSPIVDILKTRRVWIWLLQIIIGGGMAGIALTLPTARVFQYSLAFFWLLAFSSATQDIAIDGFYLLATTEREQSFFVGIRTTFYRISTIFGQGLLVIIAGLIQDHTGLPKTNLNVSAQPRIIAVAPAELPADNYEKTNAALRVIAEPAALQIEIDLESPAHPLAKSLIAEARSNNLAHGFYPAEKKSAPANPDGLWRRITQPWRDFSEKLSVATHSLELFLRRNFGPENHTATTATGNAGAVALHLSHAPGHEIVVTVGSQVGFGLKSGEEKSFSVVEGSRLVFNDKNWNQPAMVVVQLDPKLKTAASATLEIKSGNIPLAWSCTFFFLGALFLGFGIYHRFFLPYPVKDQPGTTQSLTQFWQEFFRTFAAFFKKDHIGILLLFLLLYRFAEAQLVKMVAPFLLDARGAGGLGLTTSQFGVVYGTVGIAALTCGGLCGGLLAARRGLKYWLWWMVLAIHLPDGVFIYLAYTLPDNFWVINTCIALEQFGYGFGFTAYMLYMIYIARGRHATAHYAICTGFMALGMMIPGMFSGWLQEIIGYQHFFVWVLLSTIPGFLIVKFIPLDPEFGRKTAA